MAKKAIDSEYLASVWERINSVFLEQETTKMEVAKKCGFDRKILSSYRNLTLTYFARLCEELNVSADFILFGLEKDKEKTNVTTYSPDKCYKDMSTPQEIIKETKKMMKYKGNNISINNLLGISDQKELMILADDFGLLDKKDIQESIENCKSYSEGQQKIMEVYEREYTDMSEKQYETYKFINSFTEKHSCFPSYKEIAIGVGCSLTTVVCRVEKLIDIGVIEIKQNYSISVAEYQ